VTLPIAKTKRPVTIADDLIWHCVVDVCAEPFLLLEMLCKNIKDVPFSSDNINRRVLMLSVLQSSESIQLYILIDLQFKWNIARSIKPGHFTELCVCEERERERERERFRDHYK
jgi:hypothetical protein